MGGIESRDDGDAPVRCPFRRIFLGVDVGHDDSHHQSNRHHHHRRPDHHPYNIFRQNRKLSDRRGTARCVVSVENCQLPRNSAETTGTTSPEQIEVIKLKRYSKAMCSKHVHSTITLLLSYRCHKQTDHGRVVDITCIPTTCCGEIF